ncbi:DUF3795 domain-containing protein [Chloroflexota bacterium]
MIACCGLDCSKCEGYLATQAEDDRQRAEVARQWSARFLLAPFGTVKRGYPYNNNNMEEVK